MVFHLKIKDIISELRLTRVLLVVSLFLLLSVKGWAQTATISGDTILCRNAASPDITFTGAGGETPYTFIYTINDGPDQTVTTVNGNSFVTVSVPTVSPDTFIYALVSVTDVTTIIVPATGSVTVTVNPLPTPSPIWHQ